MDNIVKLDEGRNLKITSMSAREVILKYHTLSDIEIRKGWDGIIDYLKIDNYEIKKDGVINIKLVDNQKRPFKVSSITRHPNAQNSFVLNSTTLTKASRFIMPMLRTDTQTQTSMKYNEHFVNCYVGTEGEGYMNQIYLVYRFGGDLHYQKFEEELKRHPKFDRVIDPDHHHVIYVFNMSMEDKIEFEKFKEGKYSEFSNKYKKQILKFNINPAKYDEETMKETIVYGVLHKTNTQKRRIEKLIGETLDEDLEYLSTPEESEEIYTGDIEIPLESAIEQAGKEEL
jgi:hypothetical protein